MSCQLTTNRNIIDHFHFPFLGLCSLFFKTSTFHDRVSSKLLPYENSPWKCSGSVDKKLGEVQQEGGVDGGGGGGGEGYGEEGAEGGGEAKLVEEGGGGGTGRGLRR